MGKENIVASQVQQRLKFGTGAPSGTLPIGMKYVDISNGFEYIGTPTGNKWHEPDSGQIFSGDFNDLDNRPPTIPSPISPIRTRTPADTQFWSDELIWAMNVHEGRFSAKYDGDVVKLWVFPTGTVDTTTGTPIKNSVDDTVDVQIPADGGVVYLVVEEWDDDPAVVFEIIEAHGTPGNKLTMFAKHLGKLDLSASNSFYGEWPEPDGTYFMCEKMDLSGTNMSGAENIATLANLAAYWDGKTVVDGIITLNDNACGFESQDAIDTLTTAGFIVSATLLEIEQPLGSGIETDPYIISNLGNLLWITQNSSSWGSYIELSDDINAEDTIYLNGGSGMDAIGTADGAFTGSWDGKGYTISNLKILPYSGGTGLFARISNAVVKNMTLDNINIDSTYNNTGGLCGLADNDCNIERIIIKNSNIVTSGIFCGGLLGIRYAASGTFLINECAVINTNIDAKDGAGGIVGHSSKEMTINKCFTKNVSITSTSSYNDLGNSGLVGANGSYIITINNNYLKDMSGFNVVNAHKAMMFGWCKGGIFTNLYCSSAHELLPVCVSVSPTINSCYYDITKGNNAGIFTSKTSVEMKQQSTYDGWDFDTVWAIDPEKNNGYPYLQWEEEEGLV